MAAMGFPIIGDYFYAEGKAFELASRLNLHAKSLYLNHPVTGQRMFFESEAPVLVNRPLNGGEFFTITTE